MTNELLEVPLGSGLNESVDDNLTPFEQCRLCTNAVFPNNVVQKRPGLHSIYTASGGSFVNLIRLGKHQNELLAFDNAHLYAYTSKDANAIVTRGQVPPFVASRRLLGGGNQPNAGFSIAPMAAVAEDPVTQLRVEVWSDGVVTQAAVYDPVAKQTVRVDTLADNAGNSSLTAVYVPRVAIYNSVAFAMWWDSTNTQIYYSAIDLTNVSGGWTNAASIGFGTIPSSTKWDMCVVNGSALLVVAGAFNAGSGGTTVVYYGISGTALTNLGQVFPDSTTPATYTCIGVYGDADGICVSWGRVTTSGGTDTYTLRWAAYDANMASLQAPADIQSTADIVASLADNPLQHLSVGITRYTGHGSGSTAEYVICWSVEYRSTPSTLLGGVNTNRHIPAFYSLRMTRSLGNAANIHGPIMGYKQHSKPLALSVGGTVRVFCLSVFYDFTPSSTTQTVATVNPTLVMMEPEIFLQLTDNWMVNPPRAVCAPLFAGYPILPASMDVASSSTTTGMICIGHEQSSSTNINVTSLLFDASAPGLYQNTELGSWTWIAAGCPMIYDGQQVVEAGFVNPPITPQVQATVTSAGAITKNGTMQYCAVYAWQDDAGNVHRSAPSPFSAAVNCSAGGGAAVIEVTVYPCRMTYRQDGENLSGVPGANPIKIELYRNTADTPDIWQLCTAVVNDITNATRITFSDATTDAALADRPFLYTTGGAVPSNPAPSMTALMVHADRLFGISENGTTAYFTTTLVQAEAPRFSDAFTLDWPEGPIQAQWSLETRVHAATDTGIFSLFGSGPSDTNTGNDFSPVQPWQDDLGVVDPRCIASFQGGTVFNSARGLYLEGRDGSYTWIGNQVQRSQDAYPVVTSITPLTADGVIRVTTKLLDTQGTGGQVIHWDHRRARWSTHYTTSTGWFKTGAECGIEVNGVYYQLMNDGSKVAIMKETPTSSLDDGNWVTMEIQTGWAHPGGLQGWSRLDRVIVDSELASPHGLTISVARDYSPTFDAASGIWADTDFAGISAGAVERVSFNVPTQACASFSFYVYDSAPGTPDASGFGPVFKMITAAYRPMGGQYRNVATALRR